MGLRCNNSEEWALRTGNNDLDSSRSVLHRALRYLLLHQDSDGAWRDFDDKPGRSDAWVTAYVGGRLLRSVRHLSIEIDAAISAAGRFLDGARRRTGGRGYNFRCPADSDTTALAILFLNQATGSAHPFDYATLAKFQLAHGAFATYRTNKSMHGWGRGHPEVTTTALRALSAGLQPNHVILRRGFAALAEFLRGPDPLASYWWPSPFYLEREVLMLTRDVPEARTISVPNRIATRSIGCFDHALALEVAVLRNDCPEHVALLARQLEARQCSDGSWPALPILRITDPRSREFGDGWFCSSPIVCDDRRIFTTATALAGLAMARRSST